MKINNLKVVLGVLFVSLFLLSCSNASLKTSSESLQESIKKGTDWEMYGLRGKVKSYKHLSFKAKVNFFKVKKGEMTDYSGENYECFFDKKGKILEKKWYKKDGGLDKKEIYKYNENGKNIKITRLDLDGNKLQEESFKYDENGLLIGSKFQNFKRNYLQTSIYTYNSNGKLIKKEILGRYKYTIIYKYNKNGDLREKFFTSLDHEERTKTNFSYDLRGNLISENSHRTMRDVFREKTSHQYKYDENDNLIEINIYGNLAEHNKYTFKYDDRGNKIEERYYKHDYKRNEFLKHKIDFRYDKKGNLIKSIKYEDGKAKKMVEITLEYY
ncbi:MAG: hypothetical protein CR967_02810 [Proteobacteria bacterium]|nr:MAG: hypothetical protein CR967_02810 [Pseudomonadota bacterium]